MSSLLLGIQEDPVFRKESLEAEHILLIGEDLNEWTTREIRSSLSKRNCLPVCTFPKDGLVHEPINLRDLYR